MKLILFLRNVALKFLYDDLFACDAFDETWDEINNKDLSHIWHFAVIHVASTATIWINIIEREHRFKR